jgi:hypothetical protein
MTTSTAERRAAARATHSAALEAALPPSRRRVVLVLGALVALGPATIDMYQHARK